MTTPTPPQTAMALLTTAYNATSPLDAVQQSRPVASVLDAEQAQAVALCSALLGARALDEVRRLGGDVEELLQTFGLRVGQASAGLGDGGPA